MPWGRQEPFVYVQQILFRVSVLPWTPDLILTDAYRGPLAEVFKLIEVVRNHQAPVVVDGDETNGSRSSSTSSLTLSDICLHVENVKVVAAGKENLFPEYNCLLLSPANFWQQNPSQFNKDPAILNTIFQQHNFQKTKISVAEMLLGMKIKDSGIKRYPLRARTRIIQFAVTLVLKENNERFLQTLRDKLQEIYPLNKATSSMLGWENNSQHPSTKPPTVENLTWIYYPGKFNILEFLPLVFTLALLFFYFYFFVKKMDLIRSRIILAIAAILTILGSLVMSLGFCFFFGLTISNQLKGILPYLVVLVGLENVLVITKCVLSTDETLDVKIRVARGLSKEGWSISKTLLTEITILTVGLATFVPFIQEFCIFAIVALISDFFLQMLLFSTILAMDIRPYNHSVKIEQRRRLLYDSVGNGGRRGAGGEDRGGNDDDDEDDEDGEVNHFMRYSSSSHAISPPVLGMSRSQSHPKLSSMDTAAAGGSATDVIATRGVAQSGKKKKRIPRRLKIVNFWARTRFFQRCFMIWMIVWISMIIYNSGVIETYFDIHAKSDGVGGKNVKPSTAQFNEAQGGDSSEDQLLMDSRGRAAAAAASPSPTHTSKQQAVPLFDNGNLNFTESLLRLQFPPDYDTLDFLSNFHWSSILKRYNISLNGKYISILPSIRVSHLVTPEDVVKLRNPNEKSQKHNFQWKALAAALDPIDFSDVDQSQAGGVVGASATAAAAALKALKNHQYPYSTPLYPKSPMELFFAAILICISVFVLTYTLIVMYRCICTRNYAEWRASWTDHEEVPVTGNNKVRNVLQNSLPISIKGHHQSPIECLASDGTLVASSCLEGRINVWDVASGIRMSNIGRSGGGGEETVYEQEQRGGGGGCRRKQRHQIWCLDFVDNLIAVGCADGRLEFWEGSTGKEKVRKGRRNIME